MIKFASFGRAHNRSIFFLFGLGLAFAVAAFQATCKPSEAEKSARAESGKALIGEWEGNSHTWRFRAEGTFEDEKIVEKSYPFDWVARRKGTWEVFNIAGDVLTIALHCRSEDVAGYVTYKDRESNTWHVYFIAGEGTLRWNEESRSSHNWFVLRRAGPLR
jgi:hypothetical protein